MSTTAADRARAFIGLGSNQRDPERQVRCALDELDQLPGTRVTGRSRLYRTRPWGLGNQPDFINAVAALETGLPPRTLLDELLGLERRHGRHRDAARRWGPRTLDLDLLLYDEQVHREPGLIVPHPRLHERAFALVPLMELCPDCIIPGHGRVRDLADLLDSTGVAPCRDEATQEQGWNTDS